MCVSAADVVSRVLGAGDHYHRRWGHGDVMAHAGCAGGAADVQGAAGDHVPQPVRGARAGGGEPRRPHRAEARIRQSWPGKSS